MDRGDNSMLSSGLADPKDDSDAGRCNKRSLHDTSLVQLSCHVQCRNGTMGRSRERAARVGEIFRLALPLRAWFGIQAVFDYPPTVKKLSIVTYYYIAPRMTW